jgi:putative copper resistance protein D
MTIAAALIIARFVHFSALSVLVGGALFPFYGIAASTRDSLSRLPWLPSLLISAAILTLASGLVWFALLLPDVDFALVWLFRLLLAMGLVLLTLSDFSAGRRLEAVATGSVVLLASIALTGNSGSNEGATAFQHRLADAIHLVASGVWIGALVIFSRLMTLRVEHEREEDLRSVHDALARFAGVGTIAVGSLTLSGMLNPGFFLSSLDSAYGQVLFVKLVLFAMMLGLAGVNRYWLTPRLSASLNRGDGLKAAIGALRASVLIETGLGVVVLAMVGWLGVLPPPSFE